MILFQLDQSHLDLDFHCPGSLASDADVRPAVIRPFASRRGVICPDCGAILVVPADALIGSSVPVPVHAVPLPADLYAVV
jgi:hypothetical protein